MTGSIPTTLLGSLAGEPLLLLRTILVTGLLIYGGRWLHGYHQARREEAAFAAQHGCQPVQATLPYKWPFAIDLLKIQYDALPSGRLLEFQTRYFDIAPTVRIDILGEGYMVNDPVNLETILSTRFEDFGLGPRREGLLPLLGEGIFTQDGQPWRHSRELLRRQFARIKEGELTAFNEHVNALINSLGHKVKDEPTGVVDLQPALFEYTLGTTTHLLFGEPHSSLPDAERSRLRDNFDYAATVSAIRLRLADLCWLYTPRKFRDACKGVRDWATFFSNKALDYMEEHGEEQAMEEYAFIVDLWRQTHDRTIVRDQLLHVLIAGRDTTACLLSWTFFHLVRNPRLLDRLKEDILKAEIPTSGVLTRKHIQNLPFLRCCLNETLRLYPQLPVNVRFANRTTLLPRGGGPDGKAPVLIRKGVGLGWSLTIYTETKTHTALMRGCTAQNVGKTVAWPEKLASTAFWIFTGDLASALERTMRLWSQVMPSYASCRGILTFGYLQGFRT